jgi:hypothetical protein
MYPTLGRRFALARGLTFERRTSHAFQTRPRQAHAAGVALVCLCLVPACPEGWDRARAPCACALKLDRKKQLELHGARTTKPDPVAVRSVVSNTLWTGTQEQHAHAHHVVSKYLDTAPTSSMLQPDDMITSRATVSSIK